MSFVTSDSLWLAVVEVQGRFNALLSLAPPAVRLGAAPRRESGCLGQRGVGTALSTLGFPFLRKAGREGELHHLPVSLLNLTRQQLLLAKREVSR